MTWVSVHVRPAQSGWLIHSSCSEPMAFRSGAVAEQQAHCLGRAVALAGRHAEVTVHDLLDRPIGATRYFGA